MVRRMTPYEIIFNSFRDLIIRDTQFLIKSPDAQLVEQVATERMVKLLTHAITNILLAKDNKDFDIDFVGAMNHELMQFDAELTALEVDMIAYFMWQCYIEEEVVTRLKALKTLGFSDDEIKTFSPSATLKEFYNALDNLKRGNEDKVKMCKRRSRDDFKYKRFDYNF